MKYLKLNLKDSERPVQGNYKTLLKETEDAKKWKIVPTHALGK